jgi:hypothetical protein
MGLARTDISEEHVISIFRVEKIRERRKVLDSCKQTEPQFKRTLNKYRGRGKWSVGINEVGGGCSVVIKGQTNCQHSEGGCLRGGGQRTSWADTVASRQMLPVGMTA